jgi:hypothetical protein
LLAGCWRRARAFSPLYIAQCQSGPVITAESKIQKRNTVGFFFSGVAIEVCKHITQQLFYLSDFIM